MKQTVRNALQWLNKHGAPPGLVKDYEFDWTKTDNLIGEGGFGVVWKVVDKITKAGFAIKQVKKTKETIHFLNREQFYLKSFTEKNLVKFVKSYEDDRYVYFVMLHYEQGNLEEFVEEISVSFHTCLDFMENLTTAVQHMHQEHVSHRDIKPCNILVGKDEDGDYLVLADFGLARDFPSSKSQATATGGVGTIGWRAPEVMDKKEDDKYRYHIGVDVYSLGLVFLALLLHQPEDNLLATCSCESHPHESCCNITEMIGRPEIPPLAQQLIRDMLRARETRITIGEVARRIQRIKSNITVEIRNEGDEACISRHQIPGIQQPAMNLRPVCDQDRQTLTIHNPHGDAIKTFDRNKLCLSATDKIVDVLQCGRHGRQLLLTAQREENQEMPSIPSHQLERVARVRTVEVSSSGFAQSNAGEEGPGSIKGNAEEEGPGSTQGNAEEAGPGSTQGNAEEEGPGSTQGNAEEEGPGSTQGNAEEEGPGSTQGNAEEEGPGSTQGNAEEVEHGLNEMAL